MDDTKGLHPKTKQAAHLLVESLMEIPGSTRKLLAAKYLSEGIVRKSDGTPLYSANPDLLDIIARGIGFGSQETNDIYKLSQAEWSSKDKVKHLSSFYIAMVNRIENGIQSQDEHVVEAGHINATVVAGMIDAEDPEVAKLIWDNVISRLQKPRDFKEKTIHDSILNMYGNLTDSANKVSIIKQKFIEENELGGK